MDLFALLVMNQHVLALFLCAPITVKDLQLHLWQKLILKLTLGVRLSLEEGCWSGKNPQKKYLKYAQTVYLVLPEIIEKLSVFHEDSSRDVQ